MKLHTLEPRSAQSLAFLSGVKGKETPGISVGWSIFHEESKNGGKSKKVINKLLSGL